MPIRHHNWLNSQTSRRYPLDETATGTGDDGARLKDDIILDLHLRWPEIAGRFAFLGGLTVTDHIVTAVFIAADTPNATSAFTPLAAVTVPQPAARMQYYTLTPLYPGVGGFVAFGDVREPFAIRMSSPTQGLLSPRIARPYTLLPIPSMRKEGRIDGLTGVVRLVGSQDVQIVRETVSVDESREVPAVIIRLRPATSAVNPMEQYIGPCGQRPESNNCDRPGIETINGVVPDCNGNIEIEFRELIVGAYPCGAGPAGMTVEQSLGLSDVCVEAVADRFIGQDYCAPPDSESSLPDGSEGSESSLPDGSEGSESEVPEVCTELPFLECFHGELHPRWVLKSGNYVFVDSDGVNPLCDLPCVPVYHAEEVCDESLSCSVESTSSCAAVPVYALQLNNASRKNILIWEDCGAIPSTDLRVTTQVQLTNSLQQNAGIVLNYRIVDPLTNPRTEYFVAQLQRGTNHVELVRFNGNNYVTENAIQVISPFVLGRWYEIVATVTPGVGGVIIQVSVRDVDDPAWPSPSFSILTSRWGTADGHHGVYARNAVSNFSFWQIEYV